MQLRKLLKFANLIKKKNKSHLLSVSVHASRPAGAQQRSEEGRDLE